MYYAVLVSIKFMLGLQNLSMLHLVDSEVVQLLKVIIAATFKSSHKRVLDSATSQEDKSYRTN